MARHSGKSVADWLALMADDVQVRSVADGAPGMEFSAPRNGKVAAEGYFSALYTDWEMLSFRVDEVIADGEQVAVFGHGSWRHRKTAKTAESPVIHRWRFRNGLVTECFEYYDTAKAFAAATPNPA